MTRDGSVLEAALEAVGFGSAGESDETATGGCRCSLAFDGDTLTADATNCDCDGRLASAPACRRTVIERLETRAADSVVVRSGGNVYRYGSEVSALLSGAGRFARAADTRDHHLAETVRTDPLAVAAELQTRTGPVADLGASSGLLESARNVDTYEDGFVPSVGVSFGHYTVDPTLGEGCRLRDVRSLETGSEARIYDRNDSVPLYALEVVETTLPASAMALLVEGYEAIAEGTVDGDRAPERAIERCSEGVADPFLASILERHTAGYGVLEDLFADSRISDVYVTAPVEENPLRVVCDGETMATNLSLVPAGAAALASRVRRTSGRAFSRANPTVDATVDLENGVGVRIAGVNEPVSRGVAFAFRERADDRFTVPGLVENGTVIPEAAAFLSVAVERNAAALIAGTRGAGKTTLLGTLLYELAPDTRTVVIEDTPELPVRSLQSVDRDVQALRTGRGDGPEITPAAALRTALRLGDGALVVGEIRGEEARVLYEAMRVGANANAVLGTIHGDGAADVYERVVSDLGVEPSSFAATDLVVTVQAYRTPSGKRRRLARVEEVVGSGTEVRFEPLYELDGEHARATGRIDRGESHLVDRLAGPTETYADVRAAIDERTRRLRTLAAEGRTSPADVTAAYATDRLHARRSRP
ncbi:ATPase, T2SS/T4P/T4SS family [Saliphagus sp. GCM10025317]